MNHLFDFRNIKVFESEHLPAPKTIRREWIRRIKKDDGGYRYIFDHQMRHYGSAYVKEEPMALMFNYMGTQRIIVRPEHAAMLSIVTS